MINSQQVQFFTKALYLTTFTLLLVVLPCAFIHEKTARVIFYWCGYLSVVGLFLNVVITKESLVRKNITFAFLILSLLFLGWSMLSEFFSGDTSSELLYTPRETLVSGSCNLILSFEPEV